MIMTQIMEDYFARIKGIYKDYLIAEENVNKKYPAWDDRIERAKYADGLIAEQTRLRDEEISSVREMYVQRIESIKDEKQRALKPTRKVIDTIEYQTKLSNTLSLLQLVDGDMDTEELDFIGEAMDVHVIKGLKRKYNSFQNGKLMEWFYKYDTERRIKRMESLATCVKSSIGKDANKAIKLSVVESLSNLTDY